MLDRVSKRRPGCAEVETGHRTCVPKRRILPFDWSGRNSHFARIAAGKQLGEFIRSLKADRPDRPCYVIAHSHGGNVVQYALSQPSVEACVHGCVFPGTPFISTRCRNFKLFLDTVVFHLTWLIPFVVLSVMFLGLVRKQPLRAIGLMKQSCNSIRRGNRRA
jgi:predicted alpha/beta hydrolase